LDRKPYSPDMMFHPISCINSSKGVFCLKETKPSKEAVLFTERVLPKKFLTSNDPPENEDPSLSTVAPIRVEPIPNSDISMNITAATSIAAVINVDLGIHMADFDPGKSVEEAPVESPALGTVHPAPDDTPFSEAGATVELIPAPDKKYPVLTEKEVRYLKTFINETQNYLDIFEQGLLRFEKEPDNKEILNEVFRGIRTIKDMAGAMGFINLTALAHGIENILQDIRNEKITPGPQLIEVLFLGHDHIHDSLKFILQTGTEPQLKKGGYLNQLRQILQDRTKNSVQSPESAVKTQPPPEPGLEVDPAFMAETNAGILEWANKIEIRLLLLETSPQDSALILSIFDNFQIISRLACLAMAELIRNLARQAAFLLKKCAVREIPVSKTQIDWLIQSLAYIKKIGAGIDLNGDLEFEAAVAGHLNQFPARDDELDDIDTETSEGTPIPKLGEILIARKKLTLAEVTELLAKQKAEAPELRLGQLGVKEGKLEPEVLRESLKIQQQSIFNHTPVTCEIIPETKKDPYAELRQIYGLKTTPGSQVKKIGEILISRNVINQKELDELLARQKTHPGLKLGQVAVAEKKADPKEIIQSLRTQEHQFKTINAENDNVRVSITKVDNLVDMVGELLIIQSLIEQEAVRRFDSNDYLMTNLGRMARINKEIQNLSMSLRMISLKSTFQKINRVARDTISQLDKNISFQITGEETEIDRGVAEKILEPLIHLVKNAISHGIETESIRTSRGKPPQGLVKVEASSKRGYIFIDVSDDGKGMDLEAIRHKALEKKLIEPGGSYTADEIMNLVFLPGFSTAEVIDNISGRGVGLDVVQTEIQKIGGKVEITTRPVQGSTFTLKIPINFAVFNGIIVSIDERNFIIPTINVRRILRIKPEQWVMGNGLKMLAIQDEAYPVIPIFQALGLNNPEPANLVVVLELDQKLKVLPVHGITGKREVVLKPLGNEFSGLPWIAGASILGDGKVSPILDVENIFKMEE
jgi:two-component system chemotaxis sensor kinase CheA